MLLRRTSTLWRHSGPWKQTAGELCLQNLQQRCSSSLTAQPQSPSAMASVSATAKALLVDTLDMVCLSQAPLPPPPTGPRLGCITVYYMCEAKDAAVPKQWNLLLSSRHGSQIVLGLRPRWASCMLPRNICTSIGCFMGACVALQMRSFERLGLTRYGGSFSWCSVESR